MTFVIADRTIDSLSGVYVIKNTVNGKCYVGSAVRFGKRWSEHRHDLATLKHHSVKLQRAWAKYGECAFEFKPLLVCTKNDLIFYEQRAIDAFNSVDDGYNVCPKAGSSLGVKHSEATRAKLRGKILSEDHKAKILASTVGNKFALGYRHTEETKARISASNKGKMRTLGRKLTDDHKAKIGLASTGNHYCLGNKLTDEHKAKISASLVGNANTRGHKLSEEHKEKIRISLIGNTRTLGYKHSEETKQRLRGRLLSDETKAKMSASRLGKKRGPMLDEQKIKISESRKTMFASRKEKQ